MKVKFITFVRYFFILLFVYAAISKLTTFEAFQVQLAQSPLLSAFATSIAYAVIGIELIITLLLTNKNTKLLGLYLSYGLMVAFTIYIYLILNFSNFIPCSCGGVLEKMGWTEHLWFNAIVSILGLAAIYLQETALKRFYLAAPILTILSSALVIFLFLSSEHIIKKENPFVRRFLPHHIDKPIYLDLDVNSYYIAGLTTDTLYLGNYTAPLLVTAISTDFKNKVEHQIKLEETQRSFRSLAIHIADSIFHVSDGSSPIIYKGSVANWQAKKNMEDKIYFSLLQPISNNSFLFRSQKATTGQHVLGKITVNDSTTFQLYDDALQKQIDGIFDTDGQLITDTKTKQGIYTYYYRNEYLVYHQKENHFTKGKTIDTTSVAKIQITKLSNGDRKMGAPPYKVNAKTYAYNGRLYIKSELLGKNEPKSMWSQASIIDVYEYNKNEYHHSFYAYDYQKDKIKEFAVNQTYFFALVGNALVRYEIMK